MLKGEPMIEKVDDLKHRLDMECEAYAPVRVQLDELTIRDIVQYAKEHPGYSMTLKVARTSEFPISNNYAATLVAIYDDNK